jgi:hypothetical protein
VRSPMVAHWPGGAPLGAKPIGSRRRIETHKARMCAPSHRRSPGSGTTVRAGSGRHRSVRDGGDLHMAFRVKPCKSREHSQVLLARADPKQRANRRPWCTRVSWLTISRRKT